MSSSMSHFDRFVPVLTDDGLSHTLTVPCAEYVCQCGYEGVAVPCEAYEFPRCEACGQVVMTDSEAREARL